MPAKTVFISSTFKDLHEHRRAVWDALTKFDVVVRGMEEFGARSTSPLETCLSEVEQSDVYVGIIAYRLGSIEPNSKKPYTLLEYEKAFEQREEILIYLADDEMVAFPAAVMDQDQESRNTLSTFKNRLREIHTVGTFSSPADLAEKLARDFRKRFTEYTPSPLKDGAEEYAQSARVIDEFLLLPGEFNGKEVRLKVRFLNGFFLASRKLCQQFNFAYGSTVGIRVEIGEPIKTMWEHLTELFCSADRLEGLKQLASNGEAELYAQLLFTDKDVPDTRGYLFGTTWTTVSVPMTHQVYTPAEGRVILRFSKTVQ